MGLGRSLLFTIHGVVLFLALVLVFCGFVTPRWQEMQFMQSGDIHQHGLFEDCTYGFRENAIRSWLCTFKDFSHPTYYSGGYEGGSFGQTGGMNTPYNMDVGHHDNAWWRVEIIALLTCGCFLLIIALLLIFATCGQDRANNVRATKLMAAVTAAIEALAVLLVAAGVIYFIRMAYMPFVRTAMEAGQTVREQENFGVSFYVCAIGMVLGIVSFFIGAAAAATAWGADREDKYYFRRPISNPSNTIHVIQKPTDIPVFETNGPNDPEPREFYAVHKKESPTVEIAQMNGSPHTYRSSSRASEIIISQTRV